MKLTVCCLVQSSPGFITWYPAVRSFGKLRLVSIRKWQ